MFNIFGLLSLIIFAIFLLPHLISYSGSLTNSILPMSAYLILFCSASYYLFGYLRIIILDLPLLVLSPQGFTYNSLYRSSIISWKDVSNWSFRKPSFKNTKYYLEIIFKLQTGKQNILIAFVNTRGSDLENLTDTYYHLNNQIYLGNANIEISVDDWFISRLTQHDYNKFDPN